MKPLPDNPDPSTLNVEIDQSIRIRLSIGMRSLFTVEPIPPLPSYTLHSSHVDQEEVRRIEIVFGGKSWTAITETALFQFGYDIGYYHYLDLTCRAYYMPAMVLHSLTNLEVLDALTWNTTWNVLPNPIFGEVGGQIWDVWNDVQQEWIALCLEIIAVYGLAHLDMSGEYSEKRKIDQIIASMPTK